VRLFVAIEIPDELRRAIAEFLTAMRRHAPRARWVRPETIHVTLKFIGEASAEKMEAIRDALAPIQFPAPVEMEFRGTGFFPAERRPRVFWIGIQANASLAELAGAVDGQLEPLGIARESRAFVPHLTLARFEQPGESGDLARALGDANRHSFGRMLAREFHLYESRLLREGAQHIRLETYCFAPEIT
jgi:2'-5' RNA ligase